MEQIPSRTSSASDHEHHIELGNLTDRLFDVGESNTSTAPHQKTISLKDEAVASLKLMTDAKLNVLFVFGPIAFIGASTGLIGEALCFCFAGLALIPCAER